MLDATLRPLIDPFLTSTARLLFRIGVTANQVTLTGFALGLTAVPALATGNHAWALAAILANRLADGLDGCLAAQSRPTDRGGFMDISLDFIFYSAVIFGFALGDPEHAIYGAFLIFSFVGTGSSFLAYAIFAEKRGLTTDLRGRKSLYYLGGLTEGTETIILMILMCLFPASFWLLALVFGGLCWITTASRLYAGWVDFGR